MNIPSVLLLSAAVLAGWGGAAWWRGTAPPNTGQTLTFPSPSSAASGKSGQEHNALRSPAPGSASLASISGTLAALPHNALAGAREKIAHWPPSTARTLALAMLDFRLTSPSADASLADPFAPIPEDVSPAGTRFLDLAAAMQLGKRMAGSSEDPLGEWAALDPAAASAAVLKMPNGENRTEAVDAAAAVIARADPVAAMKLVRESGEQQFGQGAAKAWVALVNQTARLAGAERTSESGADLARGLSPARQESLMLSLTDLVKGYTSPTGYRDSPGSPTMMSDDELRSLMREMSHLSSGPAKTQLLSEIALRSPDVLTNCNPGTLNPESPEHAILIANALERGLAQAPEGPISEFFSTLGTVPGGTFDSPAVLNAAAPRLLPQLANAGHVSDAVQLLPRITDPNVRRAALQSILPAWMDADPAAARAAFETAPLTALERERWERHPAFLLHPAP